MTSPIRYSLIVTMSSFSSLMKTNRKHYFSMSVSHLRKIFNQELPRPVSERTTRRYIQAAVDDGLIERIPRKKRLPDGRIVSLPNLYRFTKKGWRFVHMYMKKLLRVISITGRPKKAPKYSVHSEKYYRNGPERSEGARFLKGGDLFLPGTGVIKAL